MNANGGNLYYRKQDGIIIISIFYVNGIIMTQIFKIISAGIYETNDKNVMRKKNN